MGKDKRSQGDGLQHYTSYLQIDQYLMTRVSTDTMSGLAGMLLCRDDKSAGGLLAGVTACTISGPPGLAKYVSAFRTYAGEFSAKVEEFGVDAPSDASFALLPPIVSTGVVSISPLLLRPAARPAEAVATATNGDGEAGAPPAKRQRAELDPMAAAPSVCFVCQLADRSGKFDPLKAAALGVPKGPMYGQLTKGKSVTVAGGRVVHPHEVMDPPAFPGPLVLMVDCPSPSYLPALEAADLVAKHQAGSIVEAQAEVGGAARQRPVVVVHLSPQEMLEDEGYRCWTNSWGPECMQLMPTDPRATPDVVHLRSSKQLAMLNCLHSGLFPLPLPLDGRPFPTVAEPAAAADVAASDAAAATPAAGAAVAPAVAQEDGAAFAAAPAAAASAASGPTPARNLVRFRLMPAHTQGLDSDAVRPPFCPGEVQRELRAGAPWMAEALTKVAAAVAADHATAPTVVSTAGREELEVVFLGTASSQPGSFRNVSGIYVDRFSRGGLMVDCGEDCLGQLCRKYGQAEMERRVCELRVVWISHMHADHHGGLYHLMALRWRLMGPSGTPLLLLAPGVMWRTINLYRPLIPFRAELLPNDYFSQEVGGRVPPPYVLELLAEARAALGLAVMDSFPVDHVKHSFGLKLEGEAGWKVVFSGDTQPCPQVVAAAMGATLLVHEATFEDSLVAEARAKKHSTVGEALDTARQAGAYCTILTHFSQRYPRVPVVEEVVKARAAIAFDLMAANLADLAVLPALVEPLDLMFKAAEQGDKDGGDADEEMSEAA